MTLTAIKTDKSKAFMLSEQVKKKLHEKGFLKIFNYNDYNYFKRQVKDCNNKVDAIVKMFVDENRLFNSSDLNDYVF